MRINETLYYIKPFLDYSRVLNRMIYNGFLTIFIELDELYQNIYRNFVNHPITNWADLQSI